MNPELVFARGVDCALESIVVKNDTAAAWELPNDPEESLLIGGGHGMEIDSKQTIESVCEGRFDMEPEKFRSQTAVISA